MTDIKHLAERMNDATRIAFLSGVGMSTGSGTTHDKPPMKSQPGASHQAGRNVQSVECEMQPEWSSDAFFGGLETPRALFEAVQARLATLGDTTTRATKSQIAFHRRREFASVWTWDACVIGQQPPLMVTIVLPRRDASPRWTQVVEHAPGCFAHDLELWVPDDVDAQLAAWLTEAWGAAA